MCSKASVVGDSFALIDRVTSSHGHLLDSLVGDAVGYTDGRGIGLKVGAGVGAEVGYIDGAEVGASKGDDEGCSELSVG